MSKELLKLALKALEDLNNTNSYWWQEVNEKTVDQIRDAEYALRRALSEQPVKEQFTDEIKALAEEAGFVTWNGERWNIDDNVVDWAGPYDDELVRFYHLTREQTKKEIVDALALQQKHHDESQGSHNYWKVASNYVKENT